MILEEIVANKQIELAQWKRERPMELLSRDLPAAPACRHFKQALQLSRTVGGNMPLRVIAEIKKASPSKGVLREDFEPVAIAKTYEACGAAAISVLTDRRFFQGSLEYLSAVRSVTTLPILMKDFIIDPYQLYQARACGADAVLLIAAILDRNRLSALIERADSLGLAALVEIHSADELATALAANAEIIGINNRDLKTFQVTVDTTRRLAPLIGPGKIIVSESGIDSREMMRSLAAEAGVHAFLVGEALMRSPDIGAALRSLLH
jgi:indole-3-glycerol phosphate synthase